MEEAEYREGEREGGGERESPDRCSIEQKNQKPKISRAEKFGYTKRSTRPGTGKKSDNPRGVSCP
jgi:hypothetical protein